MRRDRRRTTASRRCSDAVVLGPVSLYKLGVVWVVDGRRRRWRGWHVEEGVSAVHGGNVGFGALGATDGPLWLGGGVIVGGLERLRG